MRTLMIVLVLAAGVLVVPRSRAQEIDPLLLVHDGEPLSLAAVVERVGDAAIRERFGPSHVLAVRMQAVRAARFLHAPELSLPDLAVLAASRDPDLAPLAMQSLLAIARSLTRAALDAREHTGGELEAAMETLAGLSVDEAARVDLRRGAELVRLQLSLLTGPSSAAEPLPE